jgi:4-azaleucine resistance transporter AzlC
MTTPLPSPRAEFMAGMRAVLPLIIGSTPFGIIFGALAVAGGISPVTAAAMSAFVYAGSAQFVAVGMVSAGVGNWVIIFTTLIVNLRHTLYATTLAPHVKHLSQRWLLPLGFWLTDESFMATIPRYNQPDQSPFKHWFYLGTTVPMYINWQLCTYIGLWAGRSIPNPGAWGLDFAFPATFIGMLMPQLVSRSVIACVLTAGIAAVIFYPLPHQLGLIIAALCGVVAGMIVERWFPYPAGTEAEQAHYHQAVQEQPSHDG